jgi:hypothetical protein
MKAQVEKIFDDLDNYLDFCRFELRDFNPAHLYDKGNENYRAFLNSQRPPRQWQDRRPRGDYNRSGNNGHRNGQSFSR